jgi:hypothetical protein
VIDTGLFGTISAGVSAETGQSGFLSELAPLNFRKKAPRRNMFNHLLKMHYAEIALPFSVWKNVNSSASYCL